MDLGVKPRTILNHLTKAFEAGNPLDVDGLRAASLLSPEEEKLVKNAFDGCGPVYLKPIFEALDQSVPYDQLDLWRLIYQVNSKGE